MRNLITQSRGAPRGRSEGDCHQEFYLVSNLWVVLCVYYNDYKGVLSLWVYFGTSVF